MSNAKRDQNNVPTLLGVSNSDGKTPVRIKVNQSYHALIAANGTAGTNIGPVNAERDENSVPTLLAVSSADGVTPVPVYADDSGRLLVDNS